MSANRFAAALTWLGGGEWSELTERHHRSAGVISGVVVGVTVALATLSAGLAVADATQWPTRAVLSVALVFGVFVGAVSRALATGPARGWSGAAARVLVGVVTAAVVGELAAMALFAGSIDARLDERAARDGESAPTVVAATAEVNKTQQARTALDDAVAEAGRRRDEALVVARCEFNPSPACPQTRITGVPGAGPGNRTANDFLADTQRQLDAAVAERDRRATELDARLAAEQDALAGAREAATRDGDRGLGARWSAMNAHCLASPGALVLRVLTSCLFAVLILLPLILKLIRGQTTEDRTLLARSTREQAETAAETAIAVKRAEVRAEIESMWAEQQLNSARMAIEAQNEIDRETQRRRVVDALEAPAGVPIGSERVGESILEPAAELAAAADSAVESDNLPAVVEPADQRQGALSIPGVTKAATRWIRPFVPPIVAGAIETTTRPLRGARQVFEETEEIHFSLRRSHRVAVMSEETGEPQVEEVRVQAATAARVERPERQARAALPDTSGPRQLPSGDS
ncbi:DUF4407 domain-containing protein [Mycolicibacterium moriokaense]|nr:DUF4407 domain-containing protein [Mycolicibacterium moriokaense]